MKGNISNVTFTSLISSHPPFSHNWPKFVPQPSKEPFDLYLPDSPPFWNFTANHHIVKDPIANDMDFESLCLFPDVKRSLCGDALQWFIHLNRLELQSWNGFIRAFLDRFQLGSESILDRIDLMDMKRRQHESFGKYARSWRNMVVKVEPSMTEREMVKAFIRTLEEPFHEKLLGLVIHRFSEVVEQGEMLEQRIKSGKFDDISIPKVLSKGETKGKEKKDKGGHATENCHALHHEIQDLIGNGEFIPLIGVEQVYDPSIKMISVEESSDDGANLTILESEVDEKFSQMHL
ncbi:hypothetical protein ACH5RR_003248 [Cinchona calisaya]|uniref:Retrotransposon gag domain-containing protein n=1 Tax=Cinchona calisaya TaxID=153742 RepID=A0ABD3AU92_9GENT